MENKKFIHDGIGYVQLVDHMGCDETVVDSARTSISSSNLKKTPSEGLIKYLWTHEHYTPFEHCFITFDLKIPFFVRSQLVRHRQVRVNEQSGRYSEFNEGEFYLPISEEIGTQDKISKQCTNSDQIPEYEKLNVINFIKQSSLRGYQDYHDLINSFKISKEVARFTLGSNFYTKIRLSGDLRAWFNVINLRVGTNVQPTTEGFISLIYTFIKDLYPVCTKYAINEEKCLRLDKVLNIYSIENYKLQEMM